VGRTQHDAAFDRGATPDRSSLRQVRLGLILGLVTWLRQDQGGAAPARWPARRLVVAMLNDTGTTEGRYLWYRLTRRAADGNDLLAVIDILR